MQCFCLCRHFAGGITPSRTHKVLPLWLIIPSIIHVLSGRLLIYIINTTKVIILTSGTCSTLGPCKINNEECDHFCFRTSPETRQCDCSYGYFLSSDCSTCDTGIQYSNTICGTIKICANIPDNDVRCSFVPSPCLMSQTTHNLRSSSGRGHEAFGMTQRLN